MTITIANGKGGTGKTTLNVFLSKWLCERGKKVLLIDIDPNCSASEALGKILCDQNSRQLLSGRPTIPYPLKANKNGGRLDLIPSDLDLDMIANVTDTQLKLQIKKQGFSDFYDYVLIDPPGTWNAQMRNAIFAAQSVIIAGKCSPLDFAATSNFFDRLNECCIEADVRVVCNSYNAASDPDKIFDQYKERFGEFLLAQPIPKMNSLKRLANNPDYHVRADLAERLLPFVNAAILNENTEAAK